MFLDRLSPYLALGTWACACACIVACTLQMPSESDVFGSADANEASGGGSGGAGMLGKSGSEDNGGTQSEGGGNNGSSGRGGSSATGAPGGSSAAAGSGGSSTSAGFDATAGLVAHFTFDESNGALAANLEDSSKNAKCVGSCARLDGRLGGAFGLRNNERATNWIELPSGIFSGYSALTLSVWFRDLSTGRSAAPLFHFSATSRDAVYFVPDDRNSQTATSGAHLGGVRSGSPFVDLWSATPETTDQEWHQVVISWAITSIDLYLDGTLAGSKPNPNAVPSQLAAASTNYLGRARDNDSPALFGEIDDLRIYDRVLTAAQVKLLYNVR